MDFTIQNILTFQLLADILGLVLGKVAVSHAVSSVDKPAFKI